MKGDFSVCDKKFIPKTWSKFKKWHKLACKNDPLSAEDRFIKLGWKLPDKKP